MVQTIYNRVTPMYYTYEGGWNTFRDENGVINCDDSIGGLYIARWYKVENPKPIPKEWLDEYREEVNK